MNITVLNPLGPSKSLTAVLDGQGAITALQWTDATPTDPKHPVAQKLNAYLSGEADELELDCNPKGTGFQQRVWAALRAIPFGTLATYKDIAEALQSSPRAVGGAVGANPIPIIIPCHRVMGSSGALTGFSAPGGIATKVVLLRHEGVEVGA